MVKPPSFDSNGMKKGAWSEDEDHKLRSYIMRYGHWNWRLLPKYAGLKRCGKSCRLRWVNYLKPGVKRGNFSKEEQDLVIKLHAELGNKWSAIAAKLPGRTDNEIKNFWHTRVEKRIKSNLAAKKAAKQRNEPAAFFSSSSMIETTDSCEATSLTSAFYDNPSLSTNSEDQLYLMFSEILNYGKDDCLEFDYPELHCSDLSSSGSSYMNNWTPEDDDLLIGGSFWNEASNSECESRDYTQQKEEGLLYHDPLLQFLDYEMNRIC